MVTKTATRGFGIKDAISEFFASVAERIGRENELYALEIVTELSKKGLIPHTGKPPYLTKPRSEADYAGYDLFITTDLGKIGFQIKSSKVGKRLFIEYYLLHDDLPFIPIFVVNRQRSRAAITETIRRTCWREYYILQEKKGIPTSP